MSEFEVGDRVRVVNADGHEKSQVGDILTIATEGVDSGGHDYGLFHRFKEVSYGLYAYRLELVEAAELQTISSEPEEGGPCPDSGCAGRLYFPLPVNCRCHLGGAPCSACTSVVLTCLSCGWEYTEDVEVRADPNDGMLDADEDEGKAKEFDRIWRQREYEKRKGQLLNSRGEFDEFWDGEHLSNAIEKTACGAEHPQAMWRARR